MADLMTYKGYSTQVEFEEGINGAEGILHGRLLGISDLVSFEAEGVAGFRAAFHEAVDDYLETCVAADQEPQAPTDETVTIEIDEHLYRRCKLAGDAFKMRVDAFIDYALTIAVRQWLETPFAEDLDEEGSEPPAQA